MARSKSPDIMLDKRENRGKHMQNGSGSSGFSSNVNKICIGSNQNRKDSISNIRSTKILKKKRSFHKIRFPISNSPSFSKIYLKDDAGDKPTSPTYHHYETFKSIEEILKKINKIDERSNDSEYLEKFLGKNEKLTLYNEIFQLIIEKDKVFGKYLKIIMKFYDRYNNEHSDLLKEKFKNLEADRINWDKEKDSFQRLIENLSRENFKLSKELENCENEIDQLENELQNFHNIDIESIPKSKESWKNIMKQNKYYKDLTQNLKNEMNVYKHNQEVFMKKFEELKQQGIEVYYEYADDHHSSSRISEVYLDLPTDLLRNKSRIPDLNLNSVSNFP